MGNTSRAVGAKAFKMKESVDDVDGSAVSNALIKKDIGGISLFAFDANQGLCEHTVPFDAEIYILDGEAEIAIGGQSQNIVAGEMVSIPANITHSFKAKVPFKMMLVMAC